jgi:hypothetical protein
MNDHSTPSCPFCPFSDPDATFVAEHIDFCHPEGAGPAIQDSHPLNTHTHSPTLSSPPVEDATDKYVDCPHGCGEIVTAAEISNHLDLHIAEGIALDDGSGEEPFPEDLVPCEHDLSDKDDSLDFPGTRKSGKRGSDRGFAGTNASKPRRARSPPSTVGPDGVKRLGVSDPSRLEVFFGRIANTVHSARSWGLMHTRRRCPRG